MRLIALALFTSCLALAQRQAQSAPRIGYVYPAGARQGSALEIAVGGQNLRGAGRVLISGSGVTATVSKYVEALTPGQANRLRDEQKELNGKRTAGNDLTEAELKRLDEIRQKLAAFIPRPSSPAIAETVLLHLEVAADAEPGPREIRLATAAGLTNTLTFQVGRLPEFTKPAMRVPAAFTAANGAAAPNRGARRAEAPVSITLPAVLNGQMMPASTDRFTFTAAKGDRIVVSAQARALIPFISDAVPGWFQASISVAAPGGREIASADHYRFQQDPVLYFEPPADGEYTLSIHDSIFRGREDFIYRVTLGQLPFLTSVFPLGAKTGSRTKLDIRGWNLPGATTLHDARAKQPGVSAVSVNNGLNALPFELSALPEALEKEPNDLRQKAQRVKLPVVVNGRIERPGDMDFYRVDAKAGEEIVAEITARRLDSPLDSVLQVSDAPGRELAINDDFGIKVDGLATHQADSRILIKLPAKGTYYLRVADTQSKGGPDYGYRLRLSRPEPGFELRVAPATINARGAATVPITVAALRKDGFAGEIALALKDAPGGFALHGGVIPAGEDRIRATLTMPSGKLDGPVSLRLEGAAQVLGKEVRRAAAPAEPMMQAFFYQHLVPVSDWMLNVIGNAQARSFWRPLTQRVQIPAGGSVAVSLFVPPRLAAQLRLTLDDPPEGVTLERTEPSRDGVTIVLRASAGAIKPGTKGNLILGASAERPADLKNASGPTRLQPIGYLPAVPYEIVEARRARR